jgi:multiple sugar transport system permease protein/raffinose/stachyose/melibiose transport system permease protein
MIRKQRDFVFYMFVLPAFVLFTVFVIVPAINAISLSFTNFDGVNTKAMHYIGLANYAEMLHSTRVHNALKNTIVMTVALMVLENAIALLLAVVVDNVRWCKNWFRSFFYIPGLVSGIIVGFIWAILANYNFGVINQLLDHLHLGFLKQDWLGDQRFSLATVILTTVWKGTGFYMIIYLAALQGVPQELGESALIDGASRLQKFRHITFPLLAGAVTVNMTLSMIGGLRVFDQIATTTDGGPGFATETLTYIIYKVAFGELRQGFGTALSIALFLLILIASVIQTTLLRRREVQL